MLLGVLISSCILSPKTLGQTTTPISTLTPSITLTPSATPTATYIPVAPAFSGTQVSISGSVISAENADRITLFSRWGNGNISKIQYSPNGRGLVTATSTGLYFYETKGYSLVDYIDTNLAISDIAISSDNKTIAALSDNKVFFFDFDSKEQLLSINVTASRIAISPDGKILATGTIKGGDSYIQLWDTKEGVLLKDFQENNGGWLHTMVFSPDGTLLATGSSATKIWRIDGTLIEEHGPYNSGGDTYSLSFSPDGTLLAEGTDDNVIRLWKVVHNIQLMDFKHIALGDYGIDNILISPDGNILAVGKRDGVYLWDIKSGNLKQTLTEDTASFRNLSWSIDSQSLAASSNKGIKIWSASDGHQITGFDSLTGALNVLDWSSTGELLAVGADEKNIQLLDTQNGNLLYTLECDGNVRSLDFSSDNRIIAAGLDSDRVEIWKIDGSLSTTLKGALSVGNTYVAFSQDNSFLVSNISAQNIEGDIYASESLQIWQTNEWLPSQSWKIGDLFLIKDLELAPDGRTLALARTDTENSLWENAIEIWDLNYGKKTHTIKEFSPGHPLNIWALSFSPDGRTISSLSRETIGYFISGLMKETVTMWGTENGEVVWSSLSTNERKGLPGYYPEAINWSSDGSLIAVGLSDGNIKILRGSDGTVLQTLIGHTMWVTGVQFSPDGRTLVSVSLDGTIRLWGIR